MPNPTANIDSTAYELQKGMAVVSPPAISRARLFTSSASTHFLLPKIPHNTRPKVFEAPRIESKHAADIASILPGISST